MRMRTILKLWYLACSWPQPAGIVRTLCIKDDGSIEVLQECGAFMDATPIPRKQRITWSLVMQLEDAAERLRRQSARYALSVAGMEFEKSIEWIGRASRKEVRPCRPRP